MHSSTMHLHHSTQQIVEHLAGLHAGSAGGFPNHHHPQEITSGSLDEIRGVEGNFLCPTWVPSELQLQQIVRSGDGILDYWYAEPTSAPGSRRMTLSVANQVALHVPPGSFESITIAGASGYLISGTWTNSLDSTGRFTNVRWVPNARRIITFERMGKAILIQASPTEHFSADTLIRIGESVGWDHAA